jgi:hypothetical protein
MRGLVIDTLVSAEIPCACEPLIARRRETSR